MCSGPFTHAPAIHSLAEGETKTSGLRRDERAFPSQRRTAWLRGGAREPCVKDLYALRWPDHGPRCRPPPGRTTHLR